MIKIRFPFYRQFDKMDCGPSCLRMIAKHHGKTYSLEYLREKCFIDRSGVSLLGISKAAKVIGMKTLAVSIPPAKIGEMPLPCIVHWRQKHFVVVYKTKRNQIYVADPAHGKLKYKNEEFFEGWTGNKEQLEEGILLLLEPTTYSSVHETALKKEKVGFKYLISYLAPFKKAIFQLLLFLFLGNILQLAFPFLTQAIVDEGVQKQKIEIIYAILLGQVMLFIGITLSNFRQNWISLRIATRVNISIISDFLIKLMKLPLSFYDLRMTGDILQRISDHYRIQNFLTATTLNILFSLLTLIVFSIVLAIYDVGIFLIFLLGSIVYAGWIILFMEQRRDLDYKRFDQQSANQSNLIQLIKGMQEIKINNCEQQKRKEWEEIQEKLLDIQIKSLDLNQYQQGGALFINELKNILVSFLAAKEVIEGSMTLGMMMAIQYIIGQLNGPINQLVSFIRSTQDAQISLERLGEVQHLEEEQPGEEKFAVFPNNQTINVKELSFRYAGINSKYVLKNLTMEILGGKVTAIVGPSGSGKTTLLKLLLKFYALEANNIYLGNKPLTNYSSRAWRGECGVVMQNGYIFSDTIARNIALVDENPDIDKVRQAAITANIHEFIESLPLSYQTNIGPEGHELSQGQKQRILIARAIYKDPKYLFFDEATNALDANNERVITQNLERFFEGRTVLIIAHRLSTVKKADKIVVLDKGQIIEQGTHIELTASRGAYYHLVKDQLELGN